MIRISDSSVLLTIIIEPMYVSFIMSRYTTRRNKFVPFGFHCILNTLGCHNIFTTDEV